MDVLALTIYRVLLFPLLEGYIDFSANSIFLAWRNDRENPASAVLVDTHYTFNFSHEGKGKKIYCCLPALYVWLSTHVFGNKCKLTCPIADHNMCYVKNKTAKEWEQCLADLNERTVCWYPPQNELTEVIYRRGNVPNVPLMGTKGCINCNPYVALRKLGYPMMGLPTDAMMIPFYEKDLGKIESMRVVRAQDTYFEKDESWEFDVVMQKRATANGLEQELRRTSYNSLVLLPLLRKYRRRSALRRQKKNQRGPIKFERGE